MINKKWLVLGGIAVLFFMCVGMTIIPLVLGMGRQVIYYSPATSDGDAPVQSYPMMPMWGRHFAGHGFLMLSRMLSCIAFPLMLLALCCLFIGRRHRWAAMHADGPGEYWRHHWHRQWRSHCYSKFHSTEEADPGAGDKPAREEV
jgi:hypothetical protein